jgi:hypothetical protein
MIKYMYCFWRILIKFGITVTFGILCRSCRVSEINFRHIVQHERDRKTFL